MYNIKYECRYHKNDIFLETDIITDDEKDFIRNILYKEDVVNIFEIDSNDEFEIFNDIIPNLYEKIKNNIFLKECMKKAASKLISEDEELGLCILYSYDFMYLTHKCVSEYLDNGLITHENMSLLKNSIDNYFNNYVNN
jgi:hypothetical protein